MQISAIFAHSQRIAFCAFALALAACGGASSDAEPAREETASENIGQSASKGALADMALGDEDAPITVIEYASLTCPHCATFHANVFPSIKEQYVETGKVRFIFREFPTAPATLSVVGSMLARCAADQGGSDAYFLVLGALFQTQRTWVTSDAPRDELVKIVSQAGIDEEAFEACVRREDLLGLINKNVSEARENYNVNSTPSFIVDGQLRHFSTVEDFSAALDAALEKAGE